MTSVPIIVVGRGSEIALKVKEGLVPEYDVIHIIYSADEAIEDLPLLLSIPPQKPSNRRANDGSQNYDVHKVLAVAVGGGFSEQEFQAIRNACKNSEDSVIWVRADVSKMASMPSPFTEPTTYGLKTAEKIKEKLDQLRGDGVDSGLYFYT